ncbi:MAG: hypothetical protein IJC58_04560 [Oscillospiraceae bacterium]|nr:hypothetical protein [Oscillospiraceae bacterium]
MRFSDRSKRTPHVKPVIRLELEDGKTRSRVILVLVLLAIGAIALIYGLFGLLNTQPGWQAIEASSTQRNCSQDFVINYDFSDVGGAASAQYKQLSELYGEASERAFQVFTPDEQPEGVHNLRYLNDHLNEAVTVDEILYDALSLVHEYGNRAIYLAPVYVEYNRIFYSESEAQAIAADPGQNPEQMRYITERAGIESELLAPLLKVLGISVITGAAGAVCADAGEKAAGYLLHLAGTVCAFGAVVPLLGKVVEMLVSYL